MGKDTKPTTQPKPLVTSIHTAIAAISLDIIAIPKKQRNESQGYNFRGVDDFYNELHELFAKHGVVMLPTIADMQFDKFLNAKGNTQFVARVRMNYRFSATDGSFLDCCTAGEAYDFGDKALNKAMSAAHKYALAQTFLIPTLDMPDADRDMIEPTVDPRQDPYAGKPMAVLEAMRDEIMKAQQQVPSALLGRIAELRCEALDNPGTATPAATTTATPTPAATTAPAAPVEPKPKRKPSAPAPAAAAAAPTPAPAPADPAPGAVPDDGFSEEEAEPAPDINESLEFVIEEKHIKHKHYVGKKLGALTQTEIQTMHDKWLLEFENAIKQNKDKAELAKHLLAVKAMWDKQAAIK